MSDTKTIICEQVERALTAAHLLEEFERKHRAFLEMYPPDLASPLRVPWVSWDARLAHAIAQYFGNDGWVVLGESREKVVDGVAVAVHGLSESKVRVPLTSPVPHLDVIATAGCAI